MRVARRWSGVVVSSTKAPSNLSGLRPSNIQQWQIDRSADELWVLTFKVGREKPDCVSRPSKKNKQKFVLFSDHKGSLLRWQARAKALEQMKGEDHQLCQREPFKYVPHQ